MVGPGAIAAAVAAEKEANQRRDQVREALERDLEAARYTTDRAFRQYDAADPAIRLVTGELEARWNKALARVTEVEGKIAAHDAAKLAPVADPASLAMLAADLKTFWPPPRNLSKAARLLHVAPKTLRLAAEAGEIESIHPLPDGPWIFSRAVLSSSPARAITERARQNPKYPRDRFPISKASSLQSHRQMGVVMRGCRSADSGRSKCVHR